MGEAAEFLGWLVIIGFAIQMLNFVIKRVYRKVIIKLPADKKELKSTYLKIMKLVIKVHKPVGICIALIIIAHFVIMFNYVRVSITGIVALAFLLIIAGLGMYGAYVNKKLSGSWLKIHRFCSFALVAAIIAHLVF